MGIEKVEYHSESKMFNYSFSEEYRSLHIADQIDDIIEEDIPLYSKRVESIEHLLNLKIECRIHDIVYDMMYNNSRSHKWGNVIIAYGLRKSATGLSVYQTNGDRYNLPEQFRDSEFSCVIAIVLRHTMRRIGGTLQTVDPWFENKVVYIGDFFECLEWMLINEVDEFIINVLPTAISSAMVDNLNLNSEVVNYSNSDGFKLHIRKTFENFAEEMRDAKDEEYYEHEEDWREAGLDEERSMDDETDGFWRWNID